MHKLNGVRKEPLKITDYNGEFRTGNEQVTLPKEFYLPKERIPDVRNQGEINSCVGFSITNIMQIFNSIECGTRDRFSPGYVYGKCRDNDDKYEGMIVSKTLDYLIKTGSCFEVDFPDNLEIPEIMKAVRSRSDLDKKAEPYHIEGYETYAYAMREKKYNCVKNALYVYKVPLLGAFNMQGGSHAMCIIGYNDNTKMFRVLNSWGKDWGKNGIGDIAYSKLDRGYLLMDAKNSNNLMPFKDVSKSEWYYNAVKSAYNAGLMNGVSDNEFEPERNLTRAEMAQILVNLSKKLDDVIKSK